jgi:predicted GNAT superfamily acetyltransferase
VVEIRPLATHDEYAACVALQREIWGPVFTDTVAPSVLQVSQRIGGVASGAFEGGRLIGFVFGLTGVRRGEIVHWSDMLAVREDARNAGVATRLKAHQRERVLAVGGTTIYWTFDPLVARNAHINFNKLGAVVDEYVPNMYGVTDSALHGGIETDRLVVAWKIVGRRASGVGRGGDRRTIEIPADFETLIRDDPKRAAEWRVDVRQAFTGALTDGYAVSGLELKTENGNARYLLERQDA